ncbi:hypothetical protein [Oceanidesulfovibrio indonesiensis]|uniref:hypothetical protein n=1 Tax=Oceanidesulfovibrio indonesiensis TaxID=54767 RepID=UPI001430F465|nr:hypothetical protein [Oceanidesulfovibrio indonesiensis]
MRTFRSNIQHHLNPLHVYCRLRTLGMSAPTALRVSGAWERIFIIAFPSCS